MARQPFGKHIVLTFDGDEVAVEAVGFSGRGCKAATKPYEDDLMGPNAEPVVIPKPELQAGPRSSAKTNAKVGE